MNRLFVQLDMEGRVPGDALRGAVHRQKVYGGSLDTVLLERRLIEPKDLLRALSAATDLPPAPIEAFRPRKHRSFDGVPKDLLEAGLAFPLGRDEAGTSLVAVHPEIPAPALDRLRAACPDARLAVTFECMLVRLRAERAGTVMPQRYAVLASRVVHALASGPAADATAPRSRRTTLGFDAGATGTVRPGAPQASAGPTPTPGPPPRGRFVPPAGDEVRAAAPLVVPTGPHDPAPGHAARDTPATEVGPGAATRPRASGPRVFTPTEGRAGGHEPPRPGDPAHTPSDDRAPAGADDTAPTTGSAGAAPPRSAPGSGPGRTGAAGQTSPATARKTPHESAATATEARPPGRAPDGDRRDGPSPAAPEPRPPSGRRDASAAVTAPSSGAPAGPGPDGGRASRGRPPAGATGRAAPPSAGGATPGGADRVLDGGAVAGHAGAPPGVDHTGGRDASEPATTAHPADHASAGAPATAAESPAQAGQREETDPPIVAKVLAQLAVAQERDDVLAALRTALGAWFDRYAIFAVRSEGLAALSAHRYDPSCVPGTAFVAPERGPVADLLREAAAAPDTPDDAWLRAAFGLRTPIPMWLGAVRLGPRPVLLLVADRRGETIAPAVRVAAARVAETAARILARVALARRNRPPVRTAPTPATPRTTAAPAMQLPHLTRIEPPAHRGPTLLGTGPVASTSARSRPEDRETLAAPAGEGSGGASAPAKNTRAPAPPSGAPTRRPGQRTSTAFEATANDETPGRFVPPPVPGGRRTTITTDTPRPPVPPPPAAGVDAADDLSDTLTGIPGTDTLPPEPAAAPTRPGIAPLSEPLLDAPARPTIALDPEDRQGTNAPDAAVERIDELIETVETHEDPRSIAQLAALGPAALSRFAARFPGPIEVLRRDLAALPPPSAHGPLLRAAVQLGPKVTSFLLERLEDLNPEVRFYAAFVFQELRDPSCIGRLVELVFDAHPEVRTIAARVLETYHRLPAFADACATVRGGLSAPNRVKQIHAARALGTLRDRLAVERLIELLSSQDRFVQETALEALCSITGQQHGLKPHRWRAWFERHGAEHRLEWVMESLRHRDVLVRRWAHDELVRLTGHRTSARPTGDKREQEACYQQWRAWWEEVGRARVAPGTARVSGSAQRA